MDEKPKPSVGISSALAKYGLVAINKHFPPLGELVPPVSSFGQRVPVQSEGLSKTYLPGGGGGYFRPVTDLSLNLPACIRIPHREADHFRHLAPPLPSQGAQQYTHKAPWEQGGGCRGGRKKNGGL